MSGATSAAGVKHEFFLRAAKLFSSTPAAPSCLGRAAQGVWLHPKRLQHRTGNEEVPEPTIFLLRAKKTSLHGRVLAKLECELLHRRVEVMQHCRSFMEGQCATVSPLSCLSLPILLVFRSNSLSARIALRLMLSSDRASCNLAKVVREYEYHVPSCKQEKESFLKRSSQGLAGTGHEWIHRGTILAMLLVVCYASGTSRIALVWFLPR